MRMTACSIQLAGGTHPYQLPIAQHGHPVGNLEHLFKMMRDVEDRQPLLLELLQAFEEAGGFLQRQ